MRTAAVLPVKRFALAKQRLGATVADPLRLELARAMVADVLLALAETEAIELTILVTREQSVAHAAGQAGALVVEDDVEQGQSAAAELGIKRALELGIERVLCVPGDCPTLDPAELRLLLEPPSGAEHRAREVVIVPDRHGLGTNGLLLCPPDAIAPSFGPGSAARHQARAAGAARGWSIERPPSLTLDIDTGADLEHLISDLEAKGHGRARRTREVLGRPKRSDILSLTGTA